MLPMMLNYLISFSKGGPLKKGTIHDPESKLKIKVSDTKFVPKKGEVRYFVTAGKEKLAFETDGYKKHKTVLILQMIAWYCMYLGLLEAQIHSTWPR
jgi:putative NADPH-quinone reductase